MSSRASNVLSLGLPISGISRRIEHGVQPLRVVAGLGFGRATAYVCPMKRNSKSSPRWWVTRIAGARAREICELEAKTAADAIKRAIREYEIEPRWQNRLAAYQVL